MPARPGHSLRSLLGQASGPCVRLVGKEKIMEQRLWSVRGAVNLDSPDEEQMVFRLSQLLSELINRNRVDTVDIVNIQFTQTEDVNFFNAAQAARQGAMKNIVSAVPLFCSMEPCYPHSLKLTIRVMLSYYHDRDHRPEPVYLYEASTLREDLLNA